MILTVTLNPLVERKLQYESVQYGGSNRNAAESLSAGGKGINVSRQLNMLGIDNLALTFSGGYNGKVLKNLLHEENIKTSFIQTADETRTCSTIIDINKNSVTSFFGNNSRPTMTEASEFLLKLQKMVANCDIVIFSGSSPSEVTDHIFTEGIRTSNELDKISILDTYGPHLRNALKAAPTIVHNNIDEIRGSFPVSDEASVFSLLDMFYSYGIKQAYITNGASDIYASNFDFHFRIINPPVEKRDATGSGDAFTAGIAYGWHNNLTFEETVIIASSLGAANASVYETCKITFPEAEKYRDDIKILPVGKKMKIIDVTPQ